MRDDKTKLGDAVGPNIAGAMEGAIPMPLDFTALVLASAALVMLVFGSDDLFNWASTRLPSGWVTELLVQATSVWKSWMDEIGVSRLPVSIRLWFEGFRAWHRADVALLAVGLLHQETAARTRGLCVPPE